MSGCLPPFPSLPALPTSQPPSQDPQPTLPSLQPPFLTGSVFANLFNSPGAPGPVPFAVLSPPHFPASTMSPLLVFTGLASAGGTPVDLELPGLLHDPASGLEAELDAWYQEYRDEAGASGLGGLGAMFRDDAQYLLPQGLAAGYPTGVSLAPVGGTRQ